MSDKTQTDRETPSLGDLLAETSILLDETAGDKEDAIRQTGAALLAAGAIDSRYIEAMLERERSVSTFVGEGVAIPHGTLAGTGLVNKDALVVLRFPAGIDWDGNDVRVCVGIAAQGNGHIALLSQLASVLLDPERAGALRASTTPAEVYELLKPAPDNQ